MIEVNGKIIDCTNNKVELGLFKTILYFNNYFIILKMLDYRLVFNSIILVVKFCLFIVFFPIMPLIYGWYDWHRSIEEYNFYNKK